MQFVAQVAQLDDEAAFRLADLENRFAAAGIQTDYYTPEVHKAAFALPGYVKKLFP